MQQVPKAFEPVYTTVQVAEILNTTTFSVRRLFKARPGLINLSASKGRATYRVPLSTLIEVMIERGYTREQADQIIRKLDTAA